jgi:hypothetical protein
MAEPPFSFDTLMTDVGKLRDKLVEIVQTLPPSPDREKLNQVIGQLIKGKEDAEKAFPEYVDVMTSSMAATRDETFKMQEEAAALQAKMEAHLAGLDARAGAAPLPDVKADDIGVFPNLHRELGDELLERFGKARPVAAVHKDLGSVHEQWLETSAPSINAWPKWDGPAIARQMLEALAILRPAEPVRPSRVVSENAWEDWDNWDDAAK